jgi:hypothetical protein
MGDGAATSVSVRSEHLQRNDRAHARPGNGPDPRVEDAFETTLAHGRDCAWTGYDPYDALRSPLVRALSFGAKWPRVAWIQLVKRCPVNVRPLLLVSKSANPKALGLVARALVFESAARGTDRRAEVAGLLARLDAMRSPGATGSGWGYPFDWQSRAFFVPEGTPSIVCSTFVANAYLDAYRAWGERAWLDRARETCEFVLSDLNRTPGPDGAFCFSYTPVDRTRVHNANLLGAALLARVARETGEGALREAALASARFSIRAQAEDGSWPYGDLPFQSWIDNFHTGFNLVSLLEIADSLGTGELDGPLRRGYAFYERSFFLADGTPRYYHDRLFPVDIHSAAQALVTFAAFAPIQGTALGMGKLVAQWALTTMRDRNGRFYFQRHPRYTHTTSFIRWSQAWMLYGLARLLAAERDGGRTADTN